MDAGTHSQKDVILITVDSLRADFVFDGPEVIDSLPTLDSLHQMSTTFSNAFSNAGFTKSSFLSIFSGTYPWMFESVQGGFGPDRPHVAEQFSEAGYETGGFHSNPYLDTDYGYDRGFDYYMGRDKGEEMDKATFSSEAWQFITRRIGSDRLSDGIRNLYQSVGSNLGIQIGGDPYLNAEDINDSVVRWVDQTDGPKFIWVHYMDVHTPYYPHEGTVSEDISKRRAVKLFHRVHDQRGDASEDDIDLLRRLYRGELQYLDRCLGDLLDDLGHHLDLNESILAFSSDHGEAFNEHGHVFHPDGVQYDELVHIPLLVNGPDFDTTTVDTPVSNIDLVPTLLSAANHPIPESCMGDDLRSLAADPPDDRIVFTEGYTEVDGRVMATSGDYKLIQYLNDGQSFLYDRVDDPKERHNCIDKKPDVRDRLHTAVDEHIQMARTHDGESNNVEVNDEVKDRLRRLGYAE